jgi:hypothetical protein
MHAVYQYIGANHQGSIGWHGQDGGIISNAASYTKGEKPLK